MDLVLHEPAAAGGLQHLEPDSVAANLPTVEVEALAWLRQTVLTALGGRVLRADKRPGEGD